MNQLFSFAQSHDVVEGVRFIASYHLYSDTEGEEWMRQMLWSAKTEQRVIDDYEVVGSYQGLTGAQFVLFTFDLEWGHGVDQDTPKVDMLSFAKELANRIVNDVDADVLCAASTTGVL